MIEIKTHEDRVKLLIETRNVELEKRIDIYDTASLTALEFLVEYTDTDIDTVDNMNWSISTKEMLFILTNFGGNLANLNAEVDRLTAIVEGLPDVDIIKNTINLNIIIDDTRLDDPRLDSDSVLKAAEALAARIHNPTIRKSLTVDNPPKKGVDDEQ